MDRPSFSVIANLGMVPVDAGFDALEISSGITRGEAVARFPEIESYPIVTSSDAHHPDNLGQGLTLFLLAEPTLDEIRLALRGECEREYLIQ